MKYVRYLALVSVVGLVMSLASVAQAKSKDNGSLNLADTVQVGSTQVAPGDYKVEWTGSGDNIEVKILKGNKTVATTQGKIVQLAERAPANAVITTTLSNNTKAIEQIQFNNRTEALSLSSPEMAQQ